ncbi:hypothetical protein LGH70_19260 [Hymenobacter sp. BT635]|uniref:DUF1634 domain-containing protein n=1 Tax=Hymenobacter nitidus TaxID=2880929 RepID=A0ABS8AH19_9BACT|nr:hypothetical protein [Hymenobacter nitidus]MCB2379743.1 hypothetical protein [Hymenobacter nitidus]
MQHPSATSPATKPFSRWILAPGLLLASFLLIISFAEWVNIGFIKDPATIASYPFGSEEAMGEGGWYYHTAELYAQQMLISWVALLPTVGAFIRALRHCSGRRVAEAYGLLILTLLVSSVRDQLHNP